MPYVGRRNDKNPFSFGTSCETPTILPSGPYAVTPPSTMVKFLATIDSQFMDSALCTVACQYHDIKESGAIYTPSHA